MHRSLATGIASAALIFVSHEAHADAQGTPNMPPPDPPPAAAPPAKPPANAARPAQVPPYSAYRRHQNEQRDVWYGWQTLIADGGWMILGVGLGRADGNLGGGVALGGYLLGGPIVHWAHGNVGKGFASLGVRIGMPTVLGLIGLVVGVAASPHDSSFSDVGGAAVGASIGIVLGVGGAIAIDAAALARESHSDDDDDARNDQAPAFHAAAPKGLFVPGSLGPILQPHRAIPGSAQITGGVVGLSAALY